MAARSRALTIALLAALALVSVWNALHYPPGLGYDAIDHIAYAEGIRAGDGLPGRDRRVLHAARLLHARGRRDGGRRPDRRSATRAGWRSC